MSVENNPKFAEWKAVLQNLIEAKNALKEGNATEADVDAALDAYYRIADEL